MKNVPLMLALALLPALAARAKNTASSPAPAAPAAALGWDIKKQGPFPVSAVEDHEQNLWVGTEGSGLWRYDPAKKSWLQFTTKDGLGDDCVYALAVDGKDRVWAGHLNRGVSVFNGDKWRNYGLLDGPLGDRVFALAVSPKDGDVWAATDMGLARYSQARDDWDYYTRASGLPSDQVKSIVFDADGVLRIAFQDGRAAHAEKDGDSLRWISDGKSTLSLPKPGLPFSTIYGSGLMAPPETVLTASSARAISFPKLPSGAALPDAADAAPFSRRLAKISLNLKPGEAVYLADDWRTQGDWVGRYGNGYTVLCGMGENGGDRVFSLQPGYDVSLRLGPNQPAGHEAPLGFKGGASFAHDLRCLYDPTSGQRRDAADEANPGRDGGADLWVNVKVPEGVHCLSFYFVNLYAHDVSSNGSREYDLQLVPWYPADREVQTADPLVRTHVADFWGGVYKQFMICGPAQYVLRIGRGGNYPTRLQGLFLDRVSGDMPPEPGYLPGFDNSPYAPPDEPVNQSYTPLADAAVTLWSELDDALTLRNALPLQMPFRLWCYRAAVAGKAPADLLERWRWQISLWTPEDRQRFEAAIKAAHAAAAP